MRYLAQFALLATLSRATVIPLVFEPNTGQTAKQVRYLAHPPHATVWFTNTEVVLGLKSADLRMRFAGGNRSPKLTAEDPTSGRANYFVGRDPDHWRTSIPQFGKVRYRDIYPGIDAVFYGKDGSLEYDLIVARGADASRIRLEFSNPSAISIGPNGDLILNIDGTEIRQHKPRIYQDGQPIDGSYFLAGKKQAGFKIAAYDHARSLVIDPILTYASYLGGSGGDFGYAITSDAQGNLYVVGATTSTNFPVPGGYNRQFAGPQEAFIAKINPSAIGGTSLVWSTYLGGSLAGTVATAVAVDRGGNVYVTGITNASDFPVLNGFQTSITNPYTCVGGDYGLILTTGVSCGDAFVTKLTSTGDHLFYSTYLGGSNTEVGDAIAVDAVGNAYVAGQTASTDFPLRGTPLLQTSLRGATDAFVSQISADGRTLMYSTFFGGSGNDSAYGMVIDSSGNLIIGGGTQSADLAVSSGAYSRTLQGVESGFVAKITLSQIAQSPILFLSYLGGVTASSAVFGVATDAAGNIYATGSTNSPNFPVTTGAFQTTLAGAPSGTNFQSNLFAGDAFVSKLNPAATGLAQLVYSTYLGGSSDEGGISILPDSSGRILIGGTTNSSDFPLTASAFQCCSNNGKPIGFIARLDPSQTGKAELLYSSLIGGWNGDLLLSLTGDAAGTWAAAAMQTHSFDAPVTASAFQKFFGGQFMGIANDGDAYVARFDLAVSGPLVTQIENAGGLAALPKGVLSPGLLFAVKGSGLGPSIPSGPRLDPGTGLVATTVAGVQVLVGGTPAPLTYVSATQINAVAPYEIAANVGGTVPVQVVYNSVPGTVLNASVIATSPGIINFDDGNGQGAIVNNDGSLNSANNPAARGSLISIYATGEGQTNPAGIDGRLANDTLDALPRPVASVGVTIAGVPCDIKYAGTAPGGVAGFLQVNVIVPTNIQTGNIPLVLTIGNQPSQAGITIAVQ
ncbi:MAG TPA: SBBP repeat-containing protein [Bryobacteraceae bacterium]|nr:SBBP repeat-containing protein [Bryobacteraceae bacterium]